MLFYTMWLNLIIDKLIIIILLLLLLLFISSINHFMIGFKSLDCDQIVWLFGWWQKSSNHFLMVKSWPSKWWSKSSWHFLTIKIIFFSFSPPFWMKFKLLDSDWVWINVIENLDHWDGDRNLVNIFERSRFVLGFF